MNTTDATTAIATIEATFTRYDAKKLAAVQNWLEYSEFSLEDVKTAVAYLVDQDQVYSPNPGELRKAMQELDLVAHAAPGHADPRLVANHQKSIREQAFTIARIRGCSFREAVEGIRDEQREWLAEGTRMDYLSESEKGWHRDRIEACVQMLASRGSGVEAPTLV